MAGLGIQDYAINFLLLQVENSTISIQQLCEKLPDEPYILTIFQEQVQVVLSRHVNMPDTIKAFVHAHMLCRLLGTCRVSKNQVCQSPSCMWCMQTWQVTILSPLHVTCCMTCFASIEVMQINGQIKIRLSPAPHVIADTVCTS